MTSCNFSMGVVLLLMDLIETGQDGWSSSAAKITLEMTSTGPHLMALGCKDEILTTYNKLTMQASHSVKI